MRKVSTAAILGPKGTYSEEALLAYTKKAKIEISNIIFCELIDEIFSCVKEEEALFGIVPVENLLNGSVSQTLDKLYLYDLNVIDEVYVEIKHYLMSKACKIEDVKIIESHPQAIEQCSRFIEQIGKEVIASSSSAAAAKIASENSDIAAICSYLNKDIYGLNILAENVGDKAYNLTRFFVISKVMHGFLRGKKWKTSLLVYPKADYPGLLADILSVFKLLEINLTRIESRPTKRKFGEYMFYLDVETSEKDENLKLALELIKKKMRNGKIRIFGSYHDFLSM